MTREDLSAAEVDLDPTRDLGRFRLGMERAKVVVAETDRELRYSWMATPYPDFKPSDVIGKRDDEFGDVESGRRVLALKRRVLNSQRPESEEIDYELSDGVHTFDVAVEPLRTETGEVIGVSLAAVDVTKRASAERALQRINDKRAAFLAILAHEMRNVVSSISLLLSPAGGDPADSRNVVSKADHYLRRLERVASDVLDEARLGQEDLALKKEKVDILALVRETLEDCSPFIEAAQLKADLAIPGGSIEVHVDPVRITQVLTNVLANAVKYTRPGGQLAVSLVKEDACVEISVSDSGHGIPSDKLESIFEPFERLNENGDGMGLGLSIARALLRLHGGDIRAFSDGPGMGSTFTIWLPCG